MLPDTVANLVKALHQHRLLEPGQWKEVATKLAGNYGEPKALARDLLQRGWLTPFQINLLFKGRGHELLLGSYVLLERLGEGGMGQVFKARQTKLGRIVALKVIRKERLTNPDAVRRFRREIESAAQLVHPNVVVAFDADQVEDTHFFAMEYVNGVDLAKRVKANGPLAVREACDLIRQAALGLQHAYERGLIHRDIKPANLLVTEQTNLLKVLDMGLARPNLESEDSAVSTLTQEGTVMGTPDYIAPEQARDAHKADIRSDLYSLGCTLYFLLTARVPFPGGTLTEKLLKHQMDTPTPLTELRPEVPPVVVDVVQCLMAKKPEDRLQTPGQLAEVLHEIVEGYAMLTAGQVSLRGTVRTGWVPASPTPTPMPGLEHTPVHLADPFADLGDTAIGSETPSKLKAAAREPAPVRVPLRTRLGNLAERTCGPLAQWLGLPPHKAWMLPAGAIVLLVLLLALLSLPRRLPSVERKGGDGKDPPEKKPLELPSPLDRLENSAIPEMERFTWMPPELVAVLGEHRGRHAGGLNHLALSPDGKTLASAGKDSKVCLWDTDTRRLRAVLTGHTAAVYATAFTPDGKMLLSAGADMMVRCWSLDGEPKEKSSVHRHTAAVKCLAVTPDGKTLISGGLDNLVILWDLSGVGPEMRSYIDDLEEPIQALGVCPPGKNLAVADGKTVRLYELAGGEPKLTATLKEPTGTVQALAFSEDGKTLAGGTQGSRLHFWDLGGAVPQERAKPLVTKGQVFGLHFYGNASLACASESPEITVYNLAKPKPGAGKKAITPGKSVLTALLTNEGRTLITGGQDATIRLWNIAGMAAEFGKTRLTGHPGASPALAFAPDGLLATAGGSFDQEIHLWSFSEPQPVFSGVLIPTSPVNVHALAFSRGGAYLAAGASNGLAVVWDMKNRKAERFALGGHTGTVVVAFAPDGKTLATGDSSKIRLFDLGDPKNPVVAEGHTAAITGLCYSPDGKRLASVSTDQTVVVWDLTIRPPRPKTYAGHTKAVACVQFSPDGQTLVSGGLDARARSWDQADGREYPDDRYSGHKAAVKSIAFSPDGNALATADDNGLLFVRDLHADRKKSYQFPAPISALAYAPDGRHLAVATANSAVYILRLSVFRGAAVA
jgi:WD40 repeat protein/serine/threonine protein kinase